MKSKKKIAIVGGGIAGASTALYLSQMPLEITLFERESSLVNGPPMCHLHAGGNLYREIDDTQCLKLLKQSIELLRFYPHGIDFRPTLIATPLYDEGEPKDLLPRLEMLQKEYARLVRKDVKNEVLGKSEEYFKLYTQEDVTQLQKESIVKNPTTLDEWMVIAVKNIELSEVKFPLILVQEYGLNMFRISASATLGLKRKKNVQTWMQTTVKNIRYENSRYHITFETPQGKREEYFDFLINAAGFRSGEIDDMLGFHRERLVEFKAAYVTKCEKYEGLWPEVIFHGKRGTPLGMAQFTPYPGGYFQLHGMTKDITLFEDGLVKSSSLSAQPKLDEKFLQKIEQGWKFSVVQNRTQAAIEHLARFIPAFKDAKVYEKPLFGAQQIPGDDASLRASEVSFETDTYARCEIVKASSVLNMADAIVQKMVELGYVQKSYYQKRFFETTQEIHKEDVDALASLTCKQRGYPETLGYVNKPYIQKS